MVIAREHEARQYVLRTAKENDVKFIRLWFTDILGTLKGFAITEAELEGALEYGMAFDGSTVQGFARRDESDMQDPQGLESPQLRDLVEHDSLHDRLDAAQVGTETGHSQPRRQDDAQQR